MKFLFVLISIIGLLYIVFKKRQFDLFTIAFASCLIYFMPGFWGVVMDPYSISQVDIEIHYETYVVFNLVNGGILLSMIVFDIFFKTRNLNYKISIQPNKYFTLTTFLISLISFIVTYLKFKEVLFNFGQITKNELLVIMENDRWNLLWIYSACFCFLSAWIEKKKVFLILASMMLGVHILIGHRSNSAFIFLSTILLVVNQATANKSLFSFFIQNSSKVLLTLIIGSFFFIIKNVLPFLQVLAFDELLNILGENENFISVAFTNSEPFLIQTTLNKVITYRISTDPFHIFDIVATLLPFSPELGFDISGHTFGKYLNQEMLFPGLSYGLANNIWASVLSSEGWFGLIVFIVLFLYLIWTSSIILIKATGLFKTFIALFFSQLFFYIHRNDFFVQMGIQKRTIILFVLCFFLANLVSQMAKLIKKKRS